MIARISAEPFSPNSLIGVQPPASFADFKTVQADGIVSLDEVMAFGDDPQIIEPSDAAIALRLYTESRETESNLVQFATVAAAMHVVGDLPKPLADTVAIYVPDHLGSASIIADATGRTIEDAVYYPYGEGRTRAGPFISEYRFSGKELDDATQLYYFTARWYLGSTGAFSTVDPLLVKEQPLGDHDGGNDFRLAQHLNLYRFGLNSPLRFIDPLGLKPGDLFETPDQAAEDFGRTYNERSIDEKREYGTVIRTASQADGRTMYTYNEIIVGTGAEVTFEENQVSGAVAVAHTHGNYNNHWLSFYNREMNEFSDGDRKSSEKLGVPLYLATPGGHLRRYDPKDNATVTLRQDMPKQKGFGVAITGISYWLIQSLSLD